MPSLEYLTGVVTGKIKGWKAFLWRILLYTLAGIYALVMPVIRWQDRINKKRLPAFVIGIGNLTAGGTGKTPATIYIAGRLYAKGISVAVLLRGYRARRPGTVKLVSDGEKVLCNLAQAGDEAYLLSRNLPGVPVVAGRNRRLAAEVAAANFHPRVMVMDDAFQQWRIYKDVEIVLIDAASPFGPGWLLPAGTLRELPSALKRADIIILTRTDQVPPAIINALKRRLSMLNPGVLIAQSIHRPGRFVSLQDWQLKRNNHHQPVLKEVAMICAIGNPASFRATLQKLKLQVGLEKIYPDHHWYDSGELNKFAEDCINQGIHDVVMTEKDAVKFPPAMEIYRPEMAFWVLTSQLQITEGEEQIWRLIKDKGLHAPGY